MSFVLPLPLHMKLSVTFRVEPGCLGPDGELYIDDFCKFAKQEVAELDANFVHWIITPRYDKNLLETEYKTNNKRLNRKKAETYLDAFGKSLSTFEEHLQERLALLIEQYIERQ